MQNTESSLFGRFLFSCPTRVRFGAGVSGELAEVMEELGAEDILVVGDPGLKDMVEAVAVRPLAAAGLRVTVFTEVEANPTDACVSAAMDLARANGCRAVVGLGGGSALDTAKAVALLATQKGELHDYFGLDLAPDKGLPCVVLPTTSGTGSEVTLWSVITDTRGDAPRKDGIGGANCYAAVALVDPELTLSLPPGLTACTGMDALTHAMEAYVSTPATPFSDLLALEAMRLVSANIVRATRQGGDLAAREAMMLGSMMAGMAFSNADVAAVHILGEALGGYFGLHHGHVMALLLPLVMRANLPAATKRTADMAVALGACSASQAAEDPAGAAEAAVAKVVELLRDLGIPPLGRLGVDSARYPEIARAAAENPFLDSNPVALTAEDFLQILKDADADTLGIAAPENGDENE
jgi:alcohol dehydrogenase class IV